MNMDLERKLAIPMEVKEMYPVSAGLTEIVEKRAVELKDIFSGKSDKFILIIGPCSADNEDSVIDYISRLRVVQDRLFRESGLKPHILLETDSLEIAKQVALKSGACMLCSDIFVDESVRRYGAFYPLRDYENHRHFYACSRKGEKLPRYAEDFIKIVTRVLNKD